MNKLYKDYMYLEAKKLLSYCPESGVFRWLNDGKIVKAGDVAGGLDSDGYLIITVRGVPMKSHRLAWFFIHGKVPRDTIDHINRIRTDNRIVNLREASRLQQMNNIGMLDRNKSGFVGVFWSKRQKKWQAQITINKQRYHVGLFNDPLEASIKREEMRNRLLIELNIFSCQKWRCSRLVIVILNRLQRGKHGNNCRD
ncbi:TPA: HNH endonuclease [Enterobacter cloacae subsp. cloacae]|nr:HNH endonuclease [Enterobacter cloacae subsp. cloacae]HED2539751.1 HNH endonuclease [Enterobacter cloacae subsp. cloacae]